MSRDKGYYQRRALQELAASRRAVTPAAMERRRQLAETFLARIGQDVVTT